ncbi:MAG: metalloregulator ArsR/SmtB family transcription factor [Gemmatimonadota bacterium]|nr:metalloregulator ArsR/SmtB family transcription factor [Gemmatimonadota bacterium]
MPYESSLDALADPSRRAIYEMLRERPRSVAELAEAVPISRPAVSQHLKVLSKSRLVRFRREGTRHLYYPDPTGLAPLREYVETLWEDVLEAFASADFGEEGAEP